MTSAIDRTNRAESARKKEQDPTQSESPKHGIYARWRERHQHPVSFALHAFAIPLMPLAGVLVVVQLIEGAWHLWWRPLVLLLFSYVVQWIGHLIEGNDMGEIIVIKKALGLPYIAVAPQYRDDKPA